MEETNIKAADCYLPVGLPRYLSGTRSYGFQLMALMPSPTGMSQSKAMLLPNWMLVNVSFVDNGRYSSFRCVGGS